MPKRLTLVGTSHIAMQSVDNIKKAIQDDNPDIVGVELDYYRYKGLLSDQSKRSSPGFSNIRKIGFKGFVFALIGSLGAKKLAKYVGTNPGVDMLEAVKTAKSNSAKVAFIDQNINITLNRFSKQLTKREIGRFFVDLGRGLFNPRAELRRFGVQEFDLSKVPSEELVSKMINHMKNRYPNVHDVLVHQRNIYMAKRIIKLMKQDDIQRMVVVVGAGHRKGISDILEQQSSVDFLVKML
ncbi:MAG: TraB/GumN family protein [Nanobdellota archaeon]